MGGRIVQYVGRSVHVRCPSVRVRGERVVSVWSGGALRLYSVRKYESERADVGGTRRDVFRKNATKCKKKIKCVRSGEKLPPPKTEY